MVTALQVILALALLGPTFPLKSEHAVSTPEETIHAAVDALQTQDFGRLWELLPASYRDDISRLVQQYAAGLSPEVHSKGFELLHKIGRQLRSQRALLLQSQVVSASVLDEATLAERFDTLTDLVDTLADCELARRDEFESLDVGAFLAGSGGTMAGQIAALIDEPHGTSALGLSEFLAAVAAAEFELVDATTRRAGVRVSHDPSGTLDDGTLVMVEVEGRWIPESLAAAWNASVAEIETKLSNRDAISERVRALQTLAELDGMLDRAATATTVEMLDSAMAGFFVTGLDLVLGGSDQIVRRMQEAEIAATMVKIQNLRGAISNYRRHYKALPMSLDDLAMPSERNFNEPYVDSMIDLTDAWGTPFWYARLGPQDYQLMSLGADKQEGGEGVDADITM